MELAQFQEGDASRLEGVADHGFDLTLSWFGAMFAPNPPEVAKEMVRVTKRGGRIVMGNWIPDDPTFVAQVLKICSAFTPPPPAGFVSPMTWGVEANVLERFGAAGVAQENVSLERDALIFRAADKSPVEVIELFRNFYGPTMRAFEAAAKDGRTDELKSPLVHLIEAQNVKIGGGTELSATYLRVTVALR